MVGGDTVSQPSELQPRRRSLWRRFRRSTAAVVGITIISVLVIGALLAPWLAPYDPDLPNLRERLQAPSAKHLLGTDQLGRDVFSRVLYAARVSLTVAGVAVTGVILVGVVIGAVAGYSGGLIDNVLMRFTDIVMSFPRFFLMLGMAAVLGRSLPVLILVIGATAWPIPARLVRSEYLSWKERDFVQAAQALGVGSGRILFRHILPNVIGSIMVIATLQVAWAILAEAGLSFIGVGVKPPTPSLGNMVADGRDYLRMAPWVTLLPGMFIFLCVMSFNLVGDALRDAFDPKMDVHS